MLQAKMNLRTLLVTCITCYRAWNRITLNYRLLNFRLSKLLICWYLDLRKLVNCTMLVNRRTLLKAIHNCWFSLQPRRPTTPCSWCIVISVGAQLYQQSLGDSLSLAELCWHGFFDSSMNISCLNGWMYSLGLHTCVCFREVYSVWYGRVGATSYIPSDKVQKLFNDMQLYPSKSQGNEFCLYGHATLCVCVCVCGYVWGSYDDVRLGTLSLCGTRTLSPCLECCLTN
jgi:hypothetical protein